MVMLVVGDVKKKENWRQTLFPLSEGAEVVVGTPWGLTQWSTKIISTCHRSQKKLSRKILNKSTSVIWATWSLWKKCQNQFGQPPSPPYIQDTGVFFFFKNATKLPQLLMIVFQHRENWVISNDVSLILAGVHGGKCLWWQSGSIIGPKVLVELKIPGAEAGPNGISDG